MKKVSVKMKYGDCLQNGDNAKKLLFWKYDNGGYASLVYDPKAKCSSDVKTYPNRYSMEWNVDSQKEQGVEICKVALDVGIKKITKEQKREYKRRNRASLQEGFQELQGMLSCYAKNGTQHQILKLFSLILSGYVARMVLKEKDEPYLYFSRAPLVRIIKHRDDLCGGFEHLQRIVLGLAVNTARDNLFDTVNPALIPSCKRITEINRCAYADLSDSLNEMYLPTIYRDTAVLIHTGFFKEKEIRDFAERNKWCSVLLFNVKKDDTWKRLFAEIDLNEMTLTQWTWDYRTIHSLMEHYTLWLADIKKDDIKKNKHLISWINSAQDIVYHYNLVNAATEKAILQGSEFELACLQMAAICSFFEYIKEQGVLDGETGETLFDRWANELFPGSRGQEVLEKGQKREQEQKQNNSEKMVSEFIELLRRILEFENGSKVYLLKSREKYPAGPELDVEKHHWAFVSTMKIDGRGKKVPVVKITYRELFELAERFNLLQGENTKQTDLKAAIEGVGKLSYVHRLDNAYINFANAKESEKSPNAVTLILEEMDFINENIRQTLLERISTEK